MRLCKATRIAMMPIETTDSEHMNNVPAHETCERAYSGGEPAFSMSSVAPGFLSFLCLFAALFRRLNRVVGRKKLKRHISDKEDPPHRPASVHLHMTIAALWV